MRPLFRILEALSVLELLSVVALLTNLTTVHSSALASALGPVHGALYLSVAVTALLGRGIWMSTRLLALVPVLGGVFVLVGLRRQSRSSARAPGGAAEAA